MCVFNFCLGFEFSYVSVSWLCVSLYRFAVFWTYKQFFIVDIQLFLEEILFCCISVMDLESVYYVIRSKWFYYIKKVKICIYICHKKLHICYKKLHIWQKNCKSPEHNYNTRDSNSNPNICGRTTHNNIAFSTIVFEKFTL